MQFGFGVELICLDQDSENFVDTDFPSDSLRKRPRLCLIAGHRFEAAPIFLEPAKSIRRVVWNVADFTCNNVAGP